MLFLYTVVCLCFSRGKNSHSVISLFVMVFNETFALRVLHVEQDLLIPGSCVAQTLVSMLYCVSVGFF